MIICFSGWRHWTDSNFIQGELSQLLRDEMLQPPNQVRVGDCPTGVDMFIRAYLPQIGVGIHPQVWEADWDRYGKQAGPIRNRAMLLGMGDGNVADLLIALPEPGSYPAPGSGTWGSIGEAYRLGVEVRIPAYQETIY